jgi:hypothetical protein
MPALKKSVPEPAGRANVEPPWLFYSLPLERAGLDSMSFRVLIHVWSRARHENGVAYEAVPSMARAMKMSERTVQRALEYLVSCCFLEIDGSHKGGRENPTRYVPLPPDRWVVGVPRTSGERK